MIVGSRPGWAEVSEQLRAELAEATYEVAFGGTAPLESEDGRCLVGVPTDFQRSWIMSRHAALIRACADRAGLVDGVEFVVHELPGHDPLQVADARAAAAWAHQRSSPSGVIARLLAERGFWSLDGHDQLTLFEVEDLCGTLRVIPSAYGVPGVYEASVFTALLSIWASGARTDRYVRTSLHELSQVLELSWSGRTATQLREAIELLKLTNYEFVVTDGEAGGAQKLFSLLDVVETRWKGPPTAPHRKVQAAFSDVVWEVVSTPRVLRPLDLSVLRRLGPQRSMARRLFILLEGLPGHRVGGGREGIERIIDHRLAATLGSRAEPRRLRQLLLRAAAVLIETAPRYEDFEIVPRRKRGLSVGDPRYVLRVVRRRYTRSE